MHDVPDSTGAERGDRVRLRKKTGRFGNVGKPIEDGIRFDSQRELDRYRELKLLQKLGEITDLKVHERFDLAPGGVQIKVRSKGYPNGRKLQYEADFTYIEIKYRRSGAVVHTTVIEDVKMQSGHRDPVYKIKKAIMEAMGHTVTEV